MPWCDKYTHNYKRIGFERSFMHDLLVLASIISLAFGFISLVRFGHSLDGTYIVLMAIFLVTSIVFARAARGEILRFSGYIHNTRPATGN